MTADLDLLFGVAFILIGMIIVFWLGMKAYIAYQHLKEVGRNVQSIIDRLENKYGRKNKSV